MEKCKENFNDIFFNWYDDFFRNKPIEEKILFREEISSRVFPELPAAKARYRFNNFQRKNNRINMPFITAKAFFEIAAEYDNSIDFNNFFSDGKE